MLPDVRGLNKAVVKRTIADYLKLYGVKYPQVGVMKPEDCICTDEQIEKARALEKYGSEDSEETS